MREKFNLLLKIACAFLLIAFLSLLTKHPAVAEMGSVDKGDSSSELNIVKKKTLQNNTAMKPPIKPGTPDPYVPPKNQNGG